MMAVPNITPPKMVHGKAGLIQSVKSFLQSPAIQKEKGTNVKEKPKKVIGGWITIQ